MRGSVDRTLAHLVAGAQLRDSNAAAIGLALRCRGRLPDGERCPRILRWRSPTAMRDPCGVNEDAVPTIRQEGWRYALGDLLCPDCDPAAHVRWVCARRTGLAAGVSG